jgi:hypothetical protein
MRRTHSVGRQYPPNGGRKSDTNSTTRCRKMAEYIQSVAVRIIRPSKQNVEIAFRYFRGKQRMSMSYEQRVEQSVKDTSGRG